MDIERIIGDMTVDEKIRLLAGTSLWETEAIERPKVPSILMPYGPDGIRLSDVASGETRKATALPTDRWLKSVSALGSVTKGN